MRFDPPLQSAILLRRYKRFLADIETLDGQRLTIHCPNTGSMLNCQQPGGRIWYTPSSDPKRKLLGTWELSETPQGRLACVNTARANRLVEEALLNGILTELAGFVELRREVRYGLENSRCDFCLDASSSSPTYVEVKSVTLGFEGSPVAAFPDAVTLRGTRHLRELSVLARQGVRTALVYCVNLTGIEAVRPAEEIDSGYAAALRDAAQAGVMLMAYAAVIDTDGIRLQRRLPVLL